MENIITLENFTSLDIYCFMSRHYWVVFWSIFWYPNNKSYRLECQNLLWDSHLLRWHNSTFWVCVCMCLPMIRELCQKLLKDRGKLWFSCQVIQVTFVPLRLPSICWWIEQSKLSIIFPFNIVSSLLGKSCYSKNSNKKVEKLVSKIHEIALYYP